MSSKYKAGLSTDDVAVAAFALAGFAWTLHAMSDNTMLLHLRTGIDMVRDRAVPHRDPYSYTAPGQLWVLQSWLAEAIYGVVNRLLGLHALIVLNALVFAFIGGGTVLVARTGNLARTVLAALIMTGIGIGQWGIRPTTFGFLLFFALIMLVERRRSMWWFALLGALWVNLHGSWPIAIIWLAASIVGSAIDKRTFPVARVRTLLALCAGIIVFGVVNPVGWRLLTFPLTPFGARGEVFPAITEWQSPNFHTLTSFSGGTVLFGIVAAVIVFARVKPRWSDLLPITAMLALALYTQRNMPFLGISLAPALGRALQVRVDDKPFVMPRRWGVLEVVSIAALLLVGTGQTIKLFTNPPFDTSTYPVAGLAYIDASGLGGKGGHVLAPDFVGCYRILTDGTNANVFIDDRYDMYPAGFTKQAFVAFRANGNVDKVLDDNHVDAVLWEPGRVLASYLDVDPRWKKVWSDKGWAVYRRA